jgi:hypothetical protein
MREIILQKRLPPRFEHDCKAKLRKQAPAGIRNQKANPALRIRKPLEICKRPPARWWQFPMAEN